MSSSESRSESKFQSSPAPATDVINEFEALLNKEFKPQGTQKQIGIQNAVRTLAQQALASNDLVSPDVTKTISAIIADIDRKLSEQLNPILHHEDFKALEGAWRGLHHLVNHTETDEMLKIRVLNISKHDLEKTLKEFEGTSWDQSPLFKKLYQEEFGTPGGQPYGCLLGDYYFDHSPEDVKMLGNIAKIASAMQAPFIAGAAASVMGMDSWQELSNPPGLTNIFQSAEYASWRSLRDSEDARYIGLAMPRFLSRLPYGAKTVPLDEFAFVEDTEGADQSKYVWANAAFAMGANITRAFKLWGWCARIRGAESGGAVEGLPVHTFPIDDGSVEMKCPTEIGITDQRQAELAKSGFVPLAHYKNTNTAVFVGAHSLQRPKVYDEYQATANDTLAAQLPYLFASSRFAHYLTCMVRDRIGSFMEKDELEHWLNEWIQNYVTTDPKASEEIKAKRPLSSAHITVEAELGRPGYYRVVLDIRPHFQLEGLTAPLRTVFRVTSPSRARG